MIRQKIFAHTDKTFTHIHKKTKKMCLKNLLFALKFVYLKKVTNFVNSLTD